MLAEKQEACNQIMRFSDAANEIEGREHDTSNGVDATIARPSVDVALNTHYCRKSCCGGLTSF